MASRTNATDNILGFDYQKLVALRYCLDANDNQIIYIECYGDIAIGNESIEVKHKKSCDTTMGNRSVDFWKTLSNLISDKLEYKTFKFFKLHTTAKITSGSIFDGWNEKSEEVRLKDIRNVTSNNTIQKYYDIVKKESDIELRSLLGKIRIDFNQPNINEMVEKLKNHPSIKFIPETNRIHLIDKMHGYVSRQAIENKNEWKIEVNEFNKDIQSFYGLFSGNSIPFPSVRKNEVQSSGTCFEFSKAMYETGYDESQVNIANTDYLRMKLTDLKILAKTSPECIEDYRDDALDMIIDEKLSHKSNYSSTTSIYKATRDMYDSCLKLDFGYINNIDGMKPYYKKGTVHHLVESKNFKIDLN